MDSLQTLKAGDIRVEVSQRIWMTLHSIAAIAADLPDHLKMLHDFLW